MARTPMIVNPNYDPNMVGISNLGRANSFAGAMDDPRFNSRMGMMSGGLPQADRTNRVGQGGAPIYDLNSTYGQQALATTMGAGGAGSIDTGVQAFTGIDYEPVRYGSGVDGYDSVQRDAQPLINLARGTGYGGMINAGLTDSYDDYLKGSRDANLKKADASGFRLRGAYSDGNAPIDNGNFSQNQTEDLNSLYGGMNDYLKDYSYVSGMSSGWDGQNKGARSAAGTLYKTEDGVMYPVTPPSYYEAPEKGGWMKENPDIMAAISLILPAVGGWAGMLGQGTTGTLSAGSGLGLTTGATNALTGMGLTTTQANAIINGVGGMLTSGSNEGAIKGLLSTLGSVGGSTLGGMVDPSFATAGGRIGSQLAGLLAPTPGSSNGGASAPGTPRTTTASAPASSVGSGSVGGGLIGLGSSGGGSGAIPNVGDRNAIARAALIQSLKNGPTRAGDAKADNPLTRELKGLLAAIPGLGAA